MGDEKEACPLFDAHLHLQDRRLDHRVERVLQEAKAAGVQHFACNGCCEEDWMKVKDLASKYKEIIPNYGLHPWFVARRSKRWLSTLRSYLESQPSAGVGECGLDRSKRAGEVSIEEQADVMIEQVKLAKELGRPLSVHCVQAFGKLQEILQQHAPFPSGFILHSWAGNAEHVKQFSRLEGVFFSISGHSLQMSPKKLEPMLRQIPDERLLLETDAPDGRPKADEEQLADLKAAEDDSSTMNHPANIRVVLDRFASLSGRDMVACARVSYKNAAALFLR